MDASTCETMQAEGTAPHEKRRAPTSSDQLPTPLTLLSLLSLMGTWHQRSVHVGFPELTSRHP
ncbi:hypothetical protein [Streptomyces sp. NPDC056883]|uniref:hypothetical protein n=1 Tax=Streptomyces sp. NPDC056883 TaxID=3345959 RepID=UPI0036C4F05C